MNFSNWQIIIDKKSQVMLTMCFHGRFMGFSSMQP